jgi:hypothetical protein
MLHRKYYDWETADYEGLNHYIESFNWYDLLTVNLTADSLWSAFCDHISAAIDMFVSSTPVLSRSRPGKPKRYYPAGIRKAVARKRCLWRLHRNNPDDHKISAAYKGAECKCKHLMYTHELKKEQRVIESKNADNFFNFVNKKMSCKRGIGALRNNQGEVITSDEQRANLLNDHFGSVCTVDDGNIPSFDRVVPDAVSLDVINFTPEKVVAAIINLKPSKSSGPDGLPPLLLKKLLCP